MRDSQGKHICEVLFIFTHRESTYVRFWSSSDRFWTPVGLRGNTCPQGTEKIYAGWSWVASLPRSPQGKGHIRATLREDAYECLRTMILAGKVIYEVLPGNTYRNLRCLKNSQGKLIWEPHRERTYVRFCSFSPTGKAHMWGFVHRLRMLYSFQSRSNF